MKLAAAAELSNMRVNACPEMQDKQGGPPNGGNGKAGGSKQQPQQGTPGSPIHQALTQQGFTLTHVQPAFGNEPHVAHYLHPEGHAAQVKLRAS